MPCNSVQDLSVTLTGGPVRSPSGNRRVSSVRLSQFLRPDVCPPLPLEFPLPLAILRGRAGHAGPGRQCVFAARPVVRERGVPRDVKVFVERLRCGWCCRRRPSDHRRRAARGAPAVRRPHASAGPESGLESAAPPADPRPVPRRRLPLGTSPRRSGRRRSARSCDPRHSAAWSGSRATTVPCRSMASSRWRHPSTTPVRWPAP